MRTLAKGGASPTDDAVTVAIQGDHPWDTWPKIQQRAEHATRILGAALTSGAGVRVAWAAGKIISRPKIERGPSRDAAFSTADRFKEAVEEALKLG